MKMNNNIKVTVIIPAYNAEKTISRCLDSIVKQNDKSIEVIVVDDGSTDNTESICQTFVSNYQNIRLYTQKNSGVSAARNKGLQLATGEWVCFIDADDFVSDNYFRISSTDDIIVYNWRYINASDDNQEISHTASYKHEMLRAFLESHLDDLVFRTPWGKLFKTNIIRQHSLKFDERLKLGEDTIFVLSYLFFCKSLSTVANIYYNYQMGNPNKKYKFDIKYSILYLSEYSHKYGQLGILCPKAIKRQTEIGYMIINLHKDFWFKCFWFSNPVVKNMIKGYFQSLDLKHKVEIIVYQILSLFIK